jgi:hypothetical protein
MKKKTPRAAGQPSQYRAIYAGLAYQFSLLGADDAQLAQVFEVEERTINNWKKKHPSFFHSMQAGKTIADAAVVKSLYNRAIAGDVQAIKYWLNNRQRSKWADRQSVEHYSGQGDFAALLKSIEGTANQLPSLRLKKEINL